MAQDGESKPVDHGPSVGSLFRQYGAQLERFLSRRAYRPQEASDMAQEVYLRMLRFPPDRVIERPHAYLYRIASNVVYDFNLKTRGAPVTFDSQIVEEFAAHAADAWTSDPGNRLMIEEELERMLMQLPRAQLVALVLHKRDGMTVAEIAAKLGVPADTVKSRIAHGLALCRAAARKSARR
jgi:RNA polymerase sigma factor (sigma-70 family)